MQWSLGFLLQPVERFFQQNNLTIKLFKKPHQKKNCLMASKEHSLPPKLVLQIPDQLLKWKLSPLLAILVIVWDINPKGFSERTSETALFKAETFKKHLKGRITTTQVPPSANSQPSDIMILIFMFINYYKTNNHFFLFFSFGESLVYITFVLLSSPRLRISRITADLRHFGQSLKSISLKANLFWSSRKLLK